MSALHPLPTVPAASPLPAAPTLPRRAAWLGWLSLALAAAAIMLTFLSDPFWLALPLTAAAVLSGRHALRHGPLDHVGALIGLNLGLLNLLLWPLVIIVAQHLLGIDPTTMFEVHDYD